MKLKSKKYKILLLILIIIIGVMLIMYISNMIRVNKIEKMTSLEALTDYNYKKKNVVLTVGIFYQGQADYIVYGPDGKELPKKEYPYEIGSITKTFTTSLLSKAVYDGQISLNDPIDKYLKLDKGTYPTIQALATHTAGYGIYPLSIAYKDIKNSITNRQNPYTDFDKQALIDSIENKKLSNKEYKWAYSNFGISVLGSVLEEVYNKDYQTLIEGFIKNDLGLSNTFVGTKPNNFKGYNKKNEISNWQWKTTDAFLPAGSLISTVGDMLKYTQIQMGIDKLYLPLGHQKFADTSAKDNDMGLGWMLDSKNNIWHNGATYGFNSFIGFNKDKQIAVVVLANYQNQKDNNTTIIGKKIMQELQDGQNIVIKK